MIKTNAYLFLSRLEESYVERMEENCIDTFHPSAKHRKWVKRYVYGKKPIDFSKPLVRVASFFFAFLLLFGAFMVTSEAARDTVSGFFTELIETIFHLHPNSGYTETAPDRIEVEFMPAYIPEGYRFIKEIRTDTVLSSTWENANGATITYQQGTLGVEFGVRAENTTEKWISNQQVLIHDGNGVIVCYWCAEEYQYSLNFSGKIDLSIIEAIIDSIQPIQ